MVHKNGISLGFDGSLDQRTAGRNARNNFAHLRAAFDLQAVMAIVLEAFGLQQRIERGEQFQAISHGHHCR